MYLGEFPQPLQFEHFLLKLYFLKYTCGYLELHINRFVSMLSKYSLHKNSKAQKHLDKSLLFIPSGEGNDSPF